MKEDGDARGFLDQRNWGIHDRGRYHFIYSLFPRVLSVSKVASFPRMTSTRCCIDCVV